MTQPADTIAVRDSHRFDIGALERYMADNVDGFAGPLRVRQFEGGQSNPTYHVTAGGRAYVVRRKPPGKLLPSAHAVDREYRVITALGQTDVPVPRTYGLCEDEGVIGTPFFIMDFVPGRVFRETPLAVPDAAQRTAIYDSMNDVLARLHRVDYRAIGLGGFGKPGNYFGRQIHRWSRQYRASETRQIAAMDRLIEWLPENIPPGDETTIVHGDYRVENMIFHAEEPRVAAVLDWELSTLGHPLADLAYNCLPYHLYGRAFHGFGDIDLEALGIPGEAEHIAAYCRRTGRDGIDHWEFYLAFSIFRIAAILQGIMGRVVAGTANAANAVSRGEAAGPCAEQGWAIVERAGLA